MLARRIATSATVAGIACAVTIAVALNRESLPTVHFPDGSSSRVLKVSFGTNHLFSPEPWWTRTLRKVLPDNLEKSLGTVRRANQATAHDSLAIYMEPLPPGGANRWLSMDVETVFPDSSVAVTRWSPSSYNPIVFENYARGEKEILVRLWGTEVKVPNPRPMQPAPWSPLPLPQTNVVAGNQVILRRWHFLRGIANGELKLEGRSPTGEPVGWMQWRTTLFDRWGNWTRAGHERRPPCPGARQERAFRLLAEGTEYISAGFVEPPAKGRYQMLRPNNRMTHSGVHLVALFGPGVYEVSHDFYIKSSSHRFAGTNANALSANGSLWLIQCADVLTLSISESAIREVRVRERLSDKKGRVFAGARAGAVNQNGLVAQLFRPSIPITTTNLEVEVIVRWPAAEFFLEKPQ